MSAVHVTSNPGSTLYEHQSIWRSTVEQAINDLIAGMEDRFTVEEDGNITIIKHVDGKMAYFIRRI